MGPLGKMKWFPNSGPWWQRADGRSQSDLYLFLPHPRVGVGHPCSLSVHRPLTWPWWSGRIT